MKKVKKFSCFVLVLLLILTGISTQKVSAASNEIKVVVNDVQLSFDQSPLMWEGRLLVPLRSIFEALGATVYWNNDTQTVTGKKGKTTIELQIGKAKALINGKEQELQVPARKINNRTMVPLRFVAESLGATVNWNKDTRTATIDDHKRAKYEEDLLKNVEVQSVKFFQSNDGKMTSGEKTYKDAFSKRETRYVHCEITLINSIPGKRLEVPLRVEYYTQNNKVLIETTVKHVIEANASTSTLEVNFGYSELEKWLMGPYTVKVFQEGDEKNAFVTGNFNIIE